LDNVSFDFLVGAVVVLELKNIRIMVRYFYYILQIILKLCHWVCGILGISSKSLIPPPISSLSPTPFRNSS
jgi:hypothetical protein